MSISLPTSFEIKETKDSRAQLVIEPCYPGYGVTLGNALRRVLLSSIEGAAITSFKLKGAHHEFSSLPMVKEDLVEIILNLKQVRVKLFSDEPATITLKVKGEKSVTAADIQKNSLVEIANPQQLILTTTDPKADVEMEMTIKKGYGYITVEEREKEKVDIGTIMIDAIYSPVTNVGFEIENMRVGERTDYERLILKIETDHTISPRHALERTAQILVEHFSLLLGSQSSTQKMEKIVTKEDKKEKEEIKEVEKKEVQLPLIADTLKKKRGRPKKNI
jgi:DNA-directed RNA polymerase subunit alpha